MERAFEVFKKGPSDSEQSLVEKEEQIAELERKVGQLTIEVDWMKKIWRITEQKVVVWILLNTIMSI